MKQVELVVHGRFPLSLMGGTFLSPVPGSALFPLSPRACALGCILPPLRGFNRPAEAEPVVYLGG